MNFLRLICACTRYDGERIWLKACAIFNVSNNFRDHFKLHVLTAKDIISVLPLRINVSECLTISYSA